MEKVIENLTETYMTENYNLAESGVQQYTPSLNARSVPSPMQQIDLKSFIDFYLNFISEVNKKSFISSLNSNNFINKFKDPSFESLIFVVF